MKTLFVLIIGAVIGVGAYLYFKQPDSRPSLERAGEKISEGAGELRDTISREVGEIDTDQIKEELAKSGRVVRRKAEEAGAVIADAAADAQITAAIKGKLAVEPDLSALSISVNTTRGIVTLAGEVSSLESIKKAMRLALDTDGVIEVASTLQVK